jgi:IS4 transposase
MTTTPKDDDPLDNALRHVREGANRVARQEAIVVRLGRIGAVALARQAADILTTLNTSLRLAREDLARHNSSGGDGDYRTHQSSGS